MSSFDSAANGMEVRTSFIRYRNALLATADLGELFVDYYLHLADNGLRVEPEHDAVFKRALAAFVLHCASRPRNEVIAWTINLQQPLLNLFLVGDNELGTVAGRVFTENVRESAENLFFCDVARPGQPVRRSAVSFTNNDPFAAAERFYEQSEQRPARYFEFSDERHALVSAHPDCDLPWLEQLDAAAAAELDQRETLAPIERRFYRWHCGCNQGRILEVLAPAMRADPDELFAGEDALRMQCPRCAGRYNVTREALEAYIAKDSE
jgi:molecular chaperone Hsp33